MTEIKVPDVGEGVTQVIITEWLKEPGDPVEKGELLVEVMTDKAAFEIDSPVSGTLSEISANADEEARVGSVIGRIEPLSE